MNITREEKQELSKYLKSLVSGETTPVCLHRGTCYSICEVLGEDYREYFADIAELWPGHSGDRHYPVRYNNMGPGEAFEFMSWAHVNMWDTSQTASPDVIEYINQRYDLLRFVIGEIDRELGDG